jgi:hypothetical protein
MFTIPLESLNRSKYGYMYLVDRKRVATATSIKFLDKNHFIVCSLVGMKMYLYHFDYNNQTYELLDQIDTTYNNKCVVTDLCDYNSNNNLIALTNFDEGTQTLYKVTDNKKLSHYKDVTNFYPKTRQYCHGVKFITDNIICVTGNRIHNLSFINLSNSDPNSDPNSDTNDTVIYNITYLSNYNPKDLAVIDSNHIVVTYTTSKVKNLAAIDAKYHARIVYYYYDLLNKSHNPLDYYDIIDCHSDCIQYTNTNGIIIMNDQLTDSVHILTIKDHKLVYLKKLQGFNMPHGLSILSDTDTDTNQILAVTNYGNNTVKMVSLSEDMVLKAFLKV